MVCSRGAASPNTFTKNKLFATSGGFCQNPACNEPLFKNLPQKEIHIAEIAHIISVSNGARNNNDISEKQKASYNNLILLCPNCHAIIDKAEADFPEALIKSWKQNHERRLEEVFGVKIFQSRKEVRYALSPLFRENKHIFDKYGPTSIERLNPESPILELWIKKVREFIIPNNRKIFNIIDKNIGLLKSKELEIFEDFKQHLHDFEGKHLFDQDTSGTTFPTKIITLYV